MTRITCSALLASALPLVAAGRAMADPINGSDGYYHHMWGGGYGFFGGGLMLLSWIAIIALIVFSVKWLIDRDGGPKGGSSTALDALKMRFAKGEIDAKEYEARRKLLEE